VETRAAGGAGFADGVGRVLPILHRHIA
jgi:hypothetical protein